MPKGSLAVTAKLAALPAVVGDGKPDTTSVLVAAGLTVMLALPVIEEVTVSVAVIDWLPAVFRVAENVWTPASPPVNV